MATYWKLEFRVISAYCTRQNHLGPCVLTASSNWITHRRSITPLLLSCVKCPRLKLSGSAVGFDFFFQWTHVPFNPATLRNNWLLACAWRFIDYV